MTIVFFSGCSLISWNWQTPVNLEMELAIEQPQPVGILPLWFYNPRNAIKGSGPMTIHLSWVEFFYDFVCAGSNSLVTGLPWLSIDSAATLVSFAYNIAYGWPAGKVIPSSHAWFHQTLLCSPHNNH
jgi:hypothetical protein